MRRDAVVVALLLVGGAVAPARAFRLPDSDQRKCYQRAPPHAVIPCAGTGQDGAYVITPLNYTENGNGTVTDNNTGLMWQRDDDGQVCNWYRASGTFDPTHNPGGDDLCASLTIGGYPDWRLPSKKELMGIVDYEIPYPGPTITASFFPNTQASDYWSSTTNAGFTEQAWDVSFNMGHADRMDYKYDLFPVRCVRGEVAAEALFVDDGDDMVIDDRTGLVWQRGETETMTWVHALDYCEGLDLGGFDDWRLPNIKELGFLADETRYAPAIDPAYFPNAHASYYWSSTTFALYPEFAWYVYFGNGDVNCNYKYGSRWVRCVRGGEPVPVAAADDDALIEEDGVATIDVLANDTGEGSLAVTSVGTPLHGTASISGTEVIYTPDANWYGADQFTYSIMDSIRAEDTATVTVTVTPVNDPPEAVDDTASTPEDTAVSIDVLANDGDPDGDTLAISAAGTPLHGTAAVSGTEIIYTPDPDYSGGDSFIYAVSDGQGGADTALVTVTVGQADFLTLVRPNGGETWRVGRTYTVTWTYAGDPGAAVRIELLRKDTLFRRIKKAAPVGAGGAGKYRWTIPAGIPAGRNYRIRITGSADPAATDESDAPFAIKKSP